MKKRSTLFFGLGAVVLSALFVVAAPVFDPNNQPWGYVAPATLNTTDVETGTGVAYAPWFEIGSFQGDIYAFPVQSSGVVDTLSPLWNARTQIDNQNWNNGRQIVTFRDGSGIPFRWPQLSAAQKADIDPTQVNGAQSDVLNFIRGDRSEEDQNGGNFRDRKSVLGTIVHSPPVYVAEPNKPYVFDDYINFSTGTAATRPKRIYVGANDGMMHAFDASTGQEVFAYIPSMVIPNLGALRVSPYAHQYYVDGIMTVGDAFDGTNWKSILVGGLGAGGKGFFAIDVTEPTAMNTSEGNVANKVLWEFDTNSANGGNLLGYSYSRPNIVRLNSGGANNDWGVIVGNGYMSSSGGASLHIRDVFDGSNIKTFSVGAPNALAPNGMSSPAVGDLDGNGTADLVFAGDLDGNLWKFDISDTNPDNWTSTLFFVATDPYGDRQSITAAPELSYHPTLGVMVYIATGRLFSVDDALSIQPQSVYGLKDTGVSLLNPTLVTQTLTPAQHAAGPVKVASNNQITTEDGWRVNLPIYENVIQDLLIRDSRVQFVAVDASTITGENWLYELDFGSGGSPGYTILDINGDKSLSANDNVDVNNNSSLLDPEDVVIGQQQRFGLASRPLVVSKGNFADVAIINHLQAIGPADVPPPALTGEDLGLIGGHFDLDTTGSGDTFDWDGGSTHEHDHEWDDKTGLATVDMFTIVECGDPLDHTTCSKDNAHLSIGDSIGNGQQFKLLVSNAELSPGAVININGVSIAATDYQSQIEAALAGTGSIPTYSFTGAAGSTEMDSLSVSFGANAIITGGLVPTATGCVRGNDPGKFNEYRNGAFTVQAVAANAFPAQVNDTGPNGAASRGGKGTGLVKHLNGGNSALLWEATLFWHWDGGCYGEDSWDTQYQNCIANGNAETCFNVCLPGRRRWEVHFDGSVEPGSTWANIGTMSITLVTRGGATTNIAFTDTNVHEQTPNENLQFGNPGVFIDMSNAKLDGSTISNIAIINGTPDPQLIREVTVNWTGGSTMTVDRVVDATPTYTVDPLTEEGVSHSKGVSMPIGDFVLEDSGANFCTVNTGYDGEVDDFGGTLTCNQDQMVYSFARLLSEGSGAIGDSLDLEAQYSENTTGVYYWVIDFTSGGANYQLLLNLINGNTIGSVTGDSHLLRPATSMSAAGKEMSVGLTNVGPAAINITGLTVAWIGAPVNQAVKKVSANNTDVYGAPDLASGQLAPLNPVQSLGQGFVGAGPDFHVSYSIDSGTAVLQDIFPSEYPVYGTASHNGSVATTALGLNANPAVLVSTIGNDLVVKLTNNEAEDLKVTVNSITWANGNSQQQFLELTDGQGDVVFNNASGQSGNMTYTINQKVTLRGVSCQDSDTSSDDQDNDKGGKKKDKDDKKGDKKDDKSDTDSKNDEDGPPIEGGDESDPGGGLTDTTQAGGSNGSVGRMKWREIVF